MTHPKSSGPKKYPAPQKKQKIAEMVPFADAGADSFKKAIAATQNTPRPKAATVNGPSSQGSPRNGATAIPPPAITNPQSITPLSAFAIRKGPRDQLGYPHNNVKEGEKQTNDGAIAIFYADQKGWNERDKNTIPCPVKYYP